VCECCGDGCKYPHRTHITILLSRRSRSRSLCNGWVENNNKAPGVGQTQRQTSSSSLPRSAKGRRAPPPSDRTDINLTASILPLVKRLSLADLHHVLAITAWRSVTTPPPSSVPRAGILAPLSGEAISESPVPCERVVAIRSCLLYAGRACEIPLVDL
jgi:hypothetical protein